MLIPVVCDKCGAPWNVDTSRSTPIGVKAGQMLTCNTCYKPPKHLPGTNAPEVIGGRWCKVDGNVYPPAAYCPGCGQDNRE